MSISERTHMSEAVAVPAQRIEVFTGAGRRRTWSAEQKAAIVAESLGNGRSVCAVARRHGLTPQQLFAWRREARRHRDAEPLTQGFVPAVMEVSAVPASDIPPVAPQPDRRRRARSTAASTIELEIDGVKVRVGSGADAATITTVIRALKAGA